MKRLPLVTLQPTAFILLEADGKFIGRHALPPDAEPVCRWCYGRPMPGQQACVRLSCIQNVASIQRIDSLLWRGKS